MVILKISEGFAGIINGLEEHREISKVRYSISELFLVSISSMLSGANSWEDMEIYGREKLEMLREYLPFEHGYPCRHTLRRFFRGLDSSKFQAVFVEWMKSLHPVLADKVVAIDGKTARHSFDGKNKALHMVGAFASEARLVLGQQAVDGKSNEIMAIPKLLDMLALEGAIVTIDFPSLLISHCATACAQ